MGPHPLPICTWDNGHPSLQAWLYPLLYMGHRPPRVMISGDYWSMYGQRRQAVRILLECFLVTIHNEVAKVMFLHVCVCPQWGGEWEYLDRYPLGTRYTPPGPGTPPRTRYIPLGPGTPPGTRYTPRDQVHPPDQVHLPGPGTPPGTRYTPPPGDGYCSGRYASYWNAFLFTVKSHKPSWVLLWVLRLFPLLLMTAFREFEVLV